MRIVIERSAARNAVCWLQRGLFTCAFVLLSYWIFVSADAWLFQRQAKAEVEKTPFIAVARNIDRPAQRPNPGDVIGRVDVDRLGISVAVVEGDDTSALKRAAGHIPGTPLPGESGNIAIAAHRDTFFRPLRNVRPKDLIRVTTSSGEFDYSVISTKIVTPQDVSVIRSDSSEVLTLITCYPFYFVGSAPRRFIVRAVRLQPDGPLAHL